METKDAYIIAGSIIVAGCIIAFSVHRPSATSALPTPLSLTPIAEPAKPLPKTPAEKLVGKWREAATWGSLQLSPDGTGLFTSPPNSIRCRWFVPEEGKIRTETDSPKKDAPGIFGDPAKVRTWSYTLTGADQLVLTYRSGDTNTGEEERLSYMRVTEDKDKKPAK